MRSLRWALIEHDRCLYTKEASGHRHTLNEELVKILGKNQQIEEARERDFIRN